MNVLPVIIAEPLFIVKLLFPILRGVSIDTI